jgi:ABC-2 type transport system permease protein
MLGYWTLTRRELANFFMSVTGYVIIAAAAFLIGGTFWSMMWQLQGEPTLVPTKELYFRTLYFWIILLLTVPVITMRLFALEKFSGTFETLMTAPVRDVEVVGAKFTAALIFYSVMWLPLLGCVLILRRYGGDHSALDYGTLGGTFLGVFLLGCPFIAFGCFASSLTKSQMAAAMLALLLCLGFFFLSFLPEHMTGGDWQSRVIGFFALRDQMQDFVRGIVDTRAVVLYLTVTFFFLFLTLRVIESRRWK